MGDQPLIGEIQMFVGTFAPQGWLYCNGAVLPISQYQSLFAVIGDRFGGDGRSSFALPDLRGRIPVGTGDRTGLTRRDLGQRAGVENVTLTIDQMPAHTHAATAQGNVSIGATTQQGNASSPDEGVVLAKGYDLEMKENVDNFVPSGASSTVPLGGAQATITPTVQNAGHGQEHENMMPWQAINYIIAWNGIFPQRS